MITSTITDVGLLRENNQDSYFASSAIDFPLFMVADGMGGHKAGEVASQLAVETIRERLESVMADLTDEELIRKHIYEAIVEANEKIYQSSLANPDYKGMGTTLTLAYIYKSKIILAHVGDSRAYIINDNMKQVTEDHSLVNELIKNGSITPEEALNHPQKNMITRALGTSPTIKIDFHVVDYLSNDIMLICSDGLSNMISEKEMLMILKYEEDLNIASRKLVCRAKDNGGKDNITVILIKFL